MSLNELVIFGPCSSADVARRAVPSHLPVPKCGERRSAETSSESQNKGSQSRSGVCAALRAEHFTFTTFLEQPQIMERFQAVASRLR